MSDDTWRAEVYWPAVDVVIPIRNEAAHLAAAVDAVRMQRYPGTIRIFLGIGPSDDGTEQAACRLTTDDPTITIVDNPSGRTPAALNAAIRAGTAPVVARVDGHSELSEGYVQRAVTTMRRTGAVNVGGRQVPRPSTPFESTVATATTSLIGTGGASYRVGGDESEVDTVYLGVFDRAAIEAVGLFDERLTRNQDYELNIRLRTAGGTVVFDPELSVGYVPRSTWTELSRQYFQYGRWKVEVARLHPGSTRVRQMLPPVAMSVVAVCTIAAVRRPILGVAPIGYAVTILAGMRGSIRTAAVVACIHVSWAAGFITSLIRRPSR